MAARYRCEGRQVADRRGEQGDEASQLAAIQQLALIQLTARRRRERTHPSLPVLPSALLNRSMKRPPLPPQQQQEPDSNKRIRHIHETAQRRPPRGPPCIPECVGKPGYSSAGLVQGPQCEDSKTSRKHVEDTRYQRWGLHEVVARGARPEVVVVAAHGAICSPCLWIQPRSRGCRLVRVEKRTTAVSVMYSTV